MTPHSAAEAAEYIGCDNGHSIQTMSGLFFDLVWPQPHMVKLRDIAEAAAKLTRFTGHIRVPYSVAQHQVYCSRLVSLEAAPYALLHDGHESYLNDKATPQKHAEVIVIAEALGADKAKVAEAVRLIPRRIDAAIFAHFGLQWPAPVALWDEVKAADILALATEKRDLMLHDRPWTFPMPAARRFPIRPWPWPKAADEFMARARELGLRED